MYDSPSDTQDKEYYDRGYSDAKAGKLHKEPFKGSGHERDTTYEDEWNYQYYSGYEAYMDEKYMKETTLKMAKPGFQKEYKTILNPVGFYWECAHVEASSYPFILPEFHFCLLDGYMGYSGSLFKKIYKTEQDAMDAYEKALVILEKYIEKARQVE